ncbi:MAG: M28 family peptidase [Planctomycetales bacterium]|nr:M28 family peptidase [Planctomycetales bacterium]
MRVLVRSAPLLLLASPFATGAAAPFAAAQEASRPDPLDPVSSIRADEYMAHIRWLSDDAREGRLTGTPGERAATAYVAERFERWGLRPGGTPVGTKGGWFQEFPVPARAGLGEGNRLSIEGARGRGLDLGHPRELTAGKDFVPLSFSPKREVTGRLVFAGYGARDEESGWDDYAGLDVKGAIVVLLRAGPKARPPGVKRPPGVMAMVGRNPEVRGQVRNAFREGAAGVLLVESPRVEGDRLPPLAGRAEPGEIPCAVVRRAVLAPVLEAAGLDLAAWQDASDGKKSPASHPDLHAEATLATEVRRVEVIGRNVVGILEGSDPAKRREFVVIGAHADHVGRNEAGGAADGNDEIHNGADDNGSGTAGLLEIAEAFATCAVRPARSVAFLSFTGEELGLLGSYHWVRNPLIPLADTVAMVNLDMIGRSREGKCSVEGNVTAEAFPDLVRGRNAGIGLTLSFPKSVRPDSDHWPFIEKGIPTIMFFTGLHPDYHKATDDWDKINGEDAARVARLAFLCAADLASRPERLAYVKPKGGMFAPQAPRGGVRLGIFSDQDFEGPGIRVTQLVPGGPAEKAGLKPGDVVVKLAGRELKEIADLHEALGKLKSGDTSEVEVRRGAETLALKIEFAAAAGAAPAPADEQPRPRLGFMPDYGFDGPGVKATEVTPDMPGSRAGLQAGDIVLKLGNLEVKGLEDLMMALGAQKPGSTVEVVVRRGEKTETLKVTFDGTPPKDK